MRFKDIDMDFDFNFPITKELVFEIVELKSRSSWRRLSELLSQKYPEGDFGDGNQIYGMEIDKAAVKYLREYFKQQLPPEELAIYLTSPNEIIRLFAAGRVPENIYYLDDIKS
jgi:hypothetical protein